MLDRERMIAALTEKAEGDHEKLFVLRRELRGLKLTALAKRYKSETGEDPYDMKVSPDKVGN